MRGLKNNKESGNSKYISKDKTDMVYFDMIFYCANKYLNILKKNIVYPQVILSWEVGEWCGAGFAYYIRYIYFFRGWGVNKLVVKLGGMGGNR